MGQNSVRSQEYIIYKYAVLPAAAAARAVLLEHCIMQ
jgi:hypothetical protein